MGRIKEDLQDIMTLLNENSINVGNTILSENLENVVDELNKAIILTKIKNCLVDYYDIETIKMIYVQAKTIKENIEKNRDLDDICFDICTKVNDKKITISQLKSINKFDLIAIIGYGAEVESMEKNNKKVIKNSTKQKKKIDSTLDWIDINDIGVDYVLLQKNKKSETLMGIKIEVPSIFLEDEDIQMIWLNKLRIIFNRCTFPIYHSFVYSPINLDKHTKKLMDQYYIEEDPLIKEMLMDEINLWEDFAKINYELEFFLIIKDSDGNRLEENFNKLFREFSKNNIGVKKLNQLDYQNLVAYQFNNELINNYFFSDIYMHINEELVADKEKEDETYEQE
ncbi:MAG: hypothetical protein WBO70_00890 [Erysipelotrichaceae bacterium]